MKQNLHIVTLGVESLERARSFYEEGLGWKKVNEEETIAFYQLSGLVLGLYPHEALADDIGIPMQKPNGYTGITLAYNTRSEAEVDEVLAKVESAGAEIVKSAEKVFWGGYSGYFRDLDGHLFEVAYNPFSPFDENDNVVMG